MSNRSESQEIFTEKYQAHKKPVVVGFKCDFMFTSMKVLQHFFQHLSVYPFMLQDAKVDAFDVLVVSHDTIVVSHHHHGRSYESK